MENHIGFTVVTPNYNMANYLEETIQSVIENLGINDEYFIIDGGSSDNSVEIIKKYEDKITGWISEPDNGYADALRKGFEMSSAPLMCWINSGDVFLRGTLDLVRRQFNNTSPDLLFGDDYYIDENSHILQHSSGYVKSLKRMMLYGGWTPLQDACYWRRSLYDAVDGINAGIQHAADYDLFLKMSLHGECEYFPAVLSAFRRHGNQKSISGQSSYSAERAKIQLRESNTSGISTSYLHLFYKFICFLRARFAFLNKKKTDKIGFLINEVEACLLASND